MSLILGNLKNVTVTRTRIMKFENGALIDRTPVMLLDISGSMRLGLTADLVGRRKIDILQDAVRKIGQGIEKYAFSDSIRKCDTNIPEPDGGTDMANAFLVLAGRSSQSILLVSDGEADDPDEAINRGISLHVPVNVLYIGEPGDRGEDFMRRLAEATRGRWMTLDTIYDTTGFPGRLEEGIEKMLLTVGA